MTIFLTNYFLSSSNRFTISTFYIINFLPIVTRKLSNSAGREEWEEIGDKEDEDEERVGGKADLGERVPFAVHLRAAPTISLQLS